MAFRRSGSQWPATAGCHTARQHDEPSRPAAPEFQDPGKPQPNLQMLLPPLSFQPCTPSLGGMSTLPRAHVARPHHSSARSSMAPVPWPSFAGGMRARMLSWIVTGSGVRTDFRCDCRTRRAMQRLDGPAGDNDCTCGCSTRAHGFLLWCAEWRTASGRLHPSPQAMRPLR
jgi:hypothetical protein